MVITLVSDIYRFFDRSKIKTEGYLRSSQRPYIKILVGLEIYGNVHRMTVIVKNELSSF